MTINHKAAPMNTTPLAPECPLLIMPLRYAVICTDDNKAREHLDSISGLLGQGVTDLALSESNFYAARASRVGYFYLLIETFGKKQWKVFYLGPNHTIMPVLPGAADIEFNDYDGVTVPVIYNANYVHNAWFFFAPDPLTDTRLQYYYDNIDDCLSKGMVQHFIPSEYIAGNTEQPHTIASKPTDNFDKKVADFAALRDPDSAINKALSGQLFLLDTSDKESVVNLVRQGTEILKYPSVGLVAYDAIGITQELNDFRNQPFDQIEHELEIMTDFNVNGLRKLKVIESINALKQGFIDGYVSDEQSAHSIVEESNLLERANERVNNPYKYHRNARDIEDSKQKLEYYRGIPNLATIVIKEEEQRFRSLTEEANQAYLQSYEGLVEEQKAAQQAYNNKLAYIEQQRLKNAKQAETTWQKKYGDRLDNNEIAAFQAALQRKKKQAYIIFDQRLPDHVTWFESKQLLLAFETYDVDHQNSGFDFALQSAMCSAGLSGTEKGQAVIDKLTTTAIIEPNNIYMRGFFNNQQSLINDANATYAEVDDQSNSAPLVIGTIIKTASKLVKGFKTVDAAYDEWVRGYKKADDGSYAKKWPMKGALAEKMGKSTGIEALLFSKLWDFNRVVFRSTIGGNNNPLDRLIMNRMKTTLYARLSNVAEYYQQHIFGTHRSGLTEADRIKEMKLRFEKIPGNVMGYELRDDAKSHANKSTVAIQEVVQGKDTHVNNYHHVRIGGVLLGLELLLLAELTTRDTLDSKTILEITASVMVALSAVTDMFYASAKAIREMPAYKGGVLDKPADAVRGGFKFSAAMFSTVASSIGIYLDYFRYTKERDKFNSDPFLMTLTVANMLNSAALSALTLASGIGYLSEYTAYKRWANKPVLWQFTRTPSYLAAGRIRMLIWVARLNWVGLSITAAEIIYLIFKDNDLQDWCDQCTFRANKQQITLSGALLMFDTLDAELEALGQASQSVNIPLTS